MWSVDGAERVPSFAVALPDKGSVQLMELQSNGKWNVPLQDCTTPQGATAMEPLVGIPLSFVDPFFRPPAIFFSFPLRGVCVCVYLFVRV